jgi:pilus assembly protein CpaB
MATGQRSQDDPKSGMARQYSTVTIDTSPDEARLLIAARDGGRLTALLRNPQDKQPIAGKYDVAALLGLNGAAAMHGGGRVRREVPVLYGGSLKSLPPEALRLAPRPGMDTAAAAPAAPAGVPAAQAAGAP